MEAWSIYSECVDVRQMEVGTRTRVRSVPSGCQRVITCFPLSLAAPQIMQLPVGMTTTCAIQRYGWVSIPPPINDDSPLATTGRRDESGAAEIILHEGPETHCDISSSRRPVQRRRPHNRPRARESAGLIQYNTSTKAGRGMSLSSHRKHG